MLGEVEAFDLLLLGRAHADDEVGDLQQHECTNECERPRHGDPHELIADLRCVGVESAERRRGVKLTTRPCGGIGSFG